MPLHSARYRARVSDDAGDLRLASPVFHLNAPPLIAGLAPWFGSRGGRVLEIGAGTGQHTAAFRLAFPSLDWTASDPDAAHRASIQAWAAHHGLPAEPPLDIDAATDWAARADVRRLGPLAAVISLNVIHIAPVEVCQGIVTGAAAALAPGGLLIFYGPFRENGAHTGAGNRRFDDGLKAENPEWGVRDAGDIRSLAEDAGLSFAALVAMPSDNRLLILRR